MVFPENNNDTADRTHLFPAGEDQIILVEPYDMKVYDQQIEYFYQQHHANILLAAATFFLNKPYLFEALGEGTDAPYSQEPLYRTDKFDCVTYVNTVLALTHSQNLTEFKKNILAIRYFHQLPAHYIYRTDWFTDLEWLPNARYLGWIEDVTVKIKDENQKSIALMAETIIDKPNWYKVKPLKTLHLLAPLPADREALLLQLRSEGNTFQPQSSQLSYLPLHKLFNKDGSANDYLFKQIPSRSIIVIARPNWQIRDNFLGFPQGYGTNLNVSHMGIALCEEGQLIFYHASIAPRKVVCVPLIDYLKDFIDSSTIKGIHVERVI